MRAILLLAAGFLLTQATVSKADYDDSFDQDEAEVELADLRAPGWNRWNCVSRSAFPSRIFRGSSYYFRQQSGEGQEAKRVALKIAFRNCEFAGGNRCSNNLTDCTVETHR